ATSSGQSRAVSSRSPVRSDGRSPGLVASQRSVRSDGTPANSTSTAGRGTTPGPGSRPVSVTRTSPGGPGGTVTAHAFAPPPAAGFPLAGGCTTTAHPSAGRTRAVTPLSAAGGNGRSTATGSAGGFPGTTG